MIILEAFGKRHPCPPCNGTGRERKKVCDRCKGDGLVVIEGFQVPQECPVCYGTGRVKIG